MMNNKSQAKCMASVFAILLYSSVAGLCQSNTVPANVVQCLGNVTITDPDSFQGPDDCVATILAYFVPHWQDIFTNWDALATTSARKYVLLGIGSRIKSPTDYMSFIENVCTLCQSGKIDAGTLRTVALVPSDYNHRNFFLVVNYKNSRVQSYIKSIRSLLPTSDGSLLDNTASGAAMQDAAYDMAVNNWTATSPDMLLP